MIQRSRSTGPVVVCGAGAAGMAAAIGAARRGSPTLLLEARDRIGGTVVHSLIHTLAGLHDANGGLLNPGLATELVERLLPADDRVAPRSMGGVHVLNVPPDVYGRVAREWLDGESNLSVSTGCRVTGASCRGDEVVELVVDSGDDLQTLVVSAVVDATGTGELARLIDPESIDDDDDRAAGGLVVRLVGVTPGGLEFPKGVGIVRNLRRAAANGRLPATCAHAWIDAGTDSCEAYLKLFVPITGNWRDGTVLARIEREARETADRVVSLLREDPAFAGTEVAEVGELGIRDGGRLRGEYRLTAEDVRAGRTFEETACRCSWPIEYWHPEKGIHLEPIPAAYEIPRDALRLRGWRNVWMAGKCLSADHLAQASARVVGTCWAMGEAAGRMAAAYVAEGVRHEPR